MLTLALCALTMQPTYFTCRHTYEHILQSELRRTLPSAEGMTNPLPGLVRVHDEVPIGLDPIYALQVLPNAAEVHAPSVSLLAKSLLRDLVTEQLAAELRSAPRGSLAMHELVPALLKGSPKPALARRCAAVARVIRDELRKTCPCARPRTREAASPSNERWLLQLLLASPESLVGSLCRVSEVSTVGGTWPCVHLRAGLAKVDLTGNVPSSAYRKLLEAFACMGVQPAAGATVYDLGACPGGWTHALRLLDCHVIAVDRSPVAPQLMADPHVTFIQGDAFTFVPGEAATGSTAVAEGHGPGDGEVWMVSDVIAYPERVAELLRRWCGSGWASRLVVTVKFQGNEPNWGALQAAIDVGTAEGYVSRAKHFFNNKNEVTLMLARSIGAEPSGA